MPNEESIKPDPNGMTPERICELYSALIAWGADIKGARERFLEDDEICKARGVDKLPNFYRHVYANQFHEFGAWRRALYDFAQLLF